LIERLNNGLQAGRQLTLISAPAGFGKTTLVTEWLQQLDQPVLWISLDEDDNDPVRFLNYLSAALRVISPELGQLLQTMLSGSQPVVVLPFITALINAIAENNTDDNFILVLDDYHLIDSAEIHTGITYLIDHQPNQIHLVFTCRADPPFHLSRLRARDLATELRARDLRFTEQEVTVLLNEKIGLNLSPKMIATLEQRTEGWIAGLQLAAVSLHQHDDPARFITAFAGDDRYIADFLAEEVLQGQTQEMQRFLLSTAILKRFCASLCDAMLGGNNSREFLNQLEASNLFIVPLDNKRHWYRYYHLFADLLRQRFEENNPPEEITRLHEKASRWFEEQDLHIESVEHALAAGDYQNAIRLIEKYADMMLLRSELHILTKWWEQLPQETITSNPQLCMLYSWAWVATGHPEKAELCVQAVEGVLGASMSDLFMAEEAAEGMDPQIRGALVEVAVVRAQLAISRMDIPEALKLCDLVLAYLEEGKDQPYIFNISEDSLTGVYFILGVAHKFMGELNAAEEEFSDAASLGTKMGNMHIVAVSFGHLANVQSTQGRLSEAVQTCRHGLQVVQELGGRLTPMSGLLQVELGNLLYERNEIDAALYHLQEGIAAAKLWDYWETYLPGYVSLARLKAGLGDWGGAFAALEELEELVQNSTQPFTPYVEALRARLWVARGEVEPVTHWVQTTSLTIDDEIDFMQAGIYFILARALILQGEYEQAAGLIDHLLEDAETGARWGQVIELLVIQTLLLETQGQQDEALEALSRALTLAKPGGYVRVFIDEGEPMARLLYLAAENDITPAYTGMLLAAFEGPAQERAYASTQVFPAPVDVDLSTTIVEPLSEREIEVLTCIANGLTNRQIALRLTIALTTVKSHTRNIYRKLGVNSRTQAVARGKSLGILP
jgi:LuxR family maltose regulon positive regulatory protein